MDRIERMFQAAGKDRAKAQELKRNLTGGVSITYMKIVFWICLSKTILFRK